MPSRSGQPAWIARLRFSRAIFSASISSTGSMSMTGLWPIRCSVAPVLIELNEKPR